MDNKIKILFLRHGKTKSNIEKRYLGRNDEELCKEGITDLNAAKKALCTEFDISFSSPLKRCLQSGNIIAPATAIVKIPQWIEMDFGPFEGKNYDELKNNQLYVKWIDCGGEIDIDGVEKKSDFIKRCMSGYDDCIKEIKRYNKLSNEGIKNVLCSVHGGTIMAILSTVLQKDYYEFMVGNASGYELIFDRDNCKLLDYRKVSF